MRFVWLLIILTACSNEKTTTFTGRAMTIDYQIVIGHVQDKQEVEKTIQAVFSEVDRIYNRFNPNSELSRLNKGPANTPLPLSKELEAFLFFTDTCVKLTEGRFDPTIEPLIHLKNFDEIEALLPAIGWHHIHIENGFFWKDTPRVSLDLSGIAKGYAVDLLIERLGYPDLLVEWGGELAARGQHPSGRPWRAYITRLQDNDPSHAIAVVELHNQALATSGDYQQSWEQDGKTYSHIINPLTGYPLEITPDSIAACSVLAPTCALADALATSGMLFASREEAKEWALKLNDPEIAFWFVSRE